MPLIREIVNQAITKGCLSIEAEKQLIELLTSKYELEDLNAFMKLQLEVMNGTVRQESRELYYAQYHTQSA
ncbi:MAG: hypothetical protein SAL07_04630 [Oscillatoria sp. PMC 1051.18]|uniref:hypothetical protein n=1 Tax=Oscillatoria salina TaxID=331517 RepID=UPI0013BE234D|nr:hypothetical protein [Oscillatoria salina]MBZ8180163.1 hypothetical protein [Oscillatoria salina IIICB1]MEC4892649.1 hypothetical protein [Oscillatoria sp. PMC 1050.18]MEC5029177.1 hypothetical protein [Oscillatoria sp. PMC 1051.18]NET88600.1 hypothetical protein [Kamptonema sp. SIO1D9]